MGEAVKKLGRLAQFGALALLLAMPLGAAVTFSSFAPSSATWFSGTVTNTGNVDAGGGQDRVGDVVFSTNGGYATTQITNLLASFNWTYVVDTLTLFDGSNYIGVWATNTNFTTNSASYLRLVDNQAPALLTWDLTNWVSGTNMVTGSYLRTNSGINGPVLLRVVNKQGTTNVFRVTPQSTATTYTFATNLQTTNIPNGSNAVMVIATNGASPALVSTNFCTLWVDNGSAQVTTLSPATYVSSASVAVSGPIQSSNAGIKTNLQIKIGANLFPATAVDTDGQGTNYNLSAIVDSTVLGNGTNTLWVVMTNNTSPSALISNSFSFYVDNALRKIVTNSWPKLWQSTDFTAAGNLTNQYSGVSGNLLLILGAVTNTVTLSPMASYFQFNQVIPTNGLLAGTNTATLIASNGATPPIVTSTNFTVLFDDQGPRVSISAPTNWVSSNITVTPSILNTNSGLKSPVVVLVGTNIANAIPYVVNSWVTNGSSNQFNVSILTTNLPNGTNTIWVTASNGSSPAVSTTTSCSLLVDNGSALVTALSPGAYVSSASVTLSGPIQSSNAGIQTNLLLKIGVSSFPATAVDTDGQGTNFNLSGAIDTTVLGNGTNTLWVVMTNNATPPALFSNSFPLYVDNLNRKIVTNTWPKVWQSADFTVAGNLTNQYSGVSGNLLLVLGSVSNSVSLNPLASIFQFSQLIPTNGLLAGTNTATLIASNGATPPIVTSTNFTVLFDDQGPRVSILAPTNWVSSNVTVTPSILNTNSGLKSPVVVLVGTNIANAISYVVSGWSTNGSSNQFDVSVITTNLPNGTNTIWVTASNGSSPAVSTTATASLFIDNGAIVITPTVPTNWQSSAVFFSGVVQGGFSGLNGNLLVAGSNFLSNVTVSNDGTFGLNLTTNLFIDGLNNYYAEASNNATPVAWVRSNFVLRLDRGVGLPQSLSPTNWVYGAAVTLSGTITNLRSGVRGVAIRAGGQTRAVDTLTPTNGGANYYFSLTLDTTSGFANGTNVVSVEVTNGATPAVMASNTFNFLVDNQAPAHSPTLRTSSAAWLQGTTNLGGTVTGSPSGVAGILVKVGTNTYSTALVTNSSNVIWSISLATTTLFQGPTNMWVWASNGAGILTSNAYAFQVDNYFPQPTNAISVYGWLSGTQNLKGSLYQPYSGLSYLGLTLSGVAIPTNQVTLSNGGGSVFFDASVDTTAFPNGTNNLVLVASNAATNAAGFVLGTNQSYVVLIDNGGPIQLTVVSTNWVRGRTNLPGTITRTNSGISGPVVIRVGSSFATASVILLTNVTTNATTFTFATNLNTSNFSSGTNTLWVTITNGATPPVESTSNYAFWVDNEVPLLLGSVVRDVTRTNAWFDLAADDTGKSGITRYTLVNLSNGYTTNLSVSNTTPLSNTLSYNLVYNFSNTLQAWSVRALDAMSNLSSSMTNLFEYNIVSNAGPAATNGILAQNAPITLIFKEPLDPAVIFDTRNIYLSSVAGNYSNQMVSTVVSLSSDLLTATVTPLAEMGQAMTRYLNISTNVLTQSGAHPITNMAFRFTTMGPLGVSNSSVAGSILGIKPAIRITFSLDVIPSTVNEQNLWFYRNDQVTNQLHYTISQVSGFGSNTYQLQLDEPLTRLTNYTLVITTNVQGVTGPRLASNVSWALATSDSFGFSTLSPQFFNVPLDAHPSIRFLTNIHPDSVTNPTPQLTLEIKDTLGATTPVSGRVVVTNQSTVMFIPDSSLVVNKTYSVTAFGGIMSTGSNLFGLTVNWEFNTGDPVAPPFATSPATNATGVRLGTLVSASFTNTRAIDSSTVSLDSFYIYASSDSNGNPVKVPAATVVKDSSNIVMTPFAPLEPSRTYTCVITTKLRWADNNGLSADQSWSFTTATALGAPTNLSPSSNAAFVLPSTAVSATFAEDLAVASVKSSSFGVVNATTGDAVPGTVSYVDKQITFTPRVPFQVRERYTATIQTGLLSLNDTPLAQPISWSFTIGAFVGPSGGTVSNGDGTFTLEFPPRALERDTLIQINNREPDSGELASLGANVPGATSFEIGPLETAFLKPVAATMKFGKTAAAGMANLAIYRYESGRWTLVGGTREGNQISFTIRSPGRYSLVQNGPGGGEEGLISCYPRVANLSDGMHISFGLATAKSGRVRIYNTSGSHVRELSGTRPLVAGDNTFFWNCRTDDGRLVAPGIYMVVVEDSSFSRILQKVISVIR